MRMKSKTSTARTDASQAGRPWEARWVWPHSGASCASRAHCPTAQTHLEAHRWPMGLLLGLVLICSVLACAPQFVGPTAAGYVFALEVPASIIYLGETAELLVSVRNAQGQLVEGVP